jgi:hypothetical protein
MQYIARALCYNNIERRVTKGTQSVAARGFWHARTGTMNIVRLMRTLNRAFLSVKLNHLCLGVYSRVKLYDISLYCA